MVASEQLANETEHPQGFYSPDHGHFFLAADRDKFKNRFEKRRLLEPVTLDVTFCRNEIPEFDAMFGSYSALFRHQGDVYAQLVRVFYSNLGCLDEEEVLVVSRVRGTVFAFNPLSLNQLLGTPQDGLRIYVGETWPSNLAGEFPRNIRDAIVATFGQNRGSAEDVDVSELNMNQRVFVDIVTRIINPRKNGFPRLTASDVFWVWALTHKVQINYGYFVLRRMMDVAEKADCLPFGLFLSALFRQVWVDLEEEEKLAPTAKLVIGRNMVRRFGFVKRGGEWLRMGARVEEEPREGDRPDENDQVSCHKRPREDGDSASESKLEQLDEKIDSVHEELGRVRESQERIEKLLATLLSVVQARGTLSSVPVQQRQDPLHDCMI